MKKRLSVAEEFSGTPGPRYKVEGDFSGELFRQNHLEPMYLKCKAQNEVLEVDLDNTEGYATSFLEESFGGLKRKYPDDDIFTVIVVKSNDEPFLVDEVKKCVDEALDKA